MSKHFLYDIYLLILFEGDSSAGVPPVPIPNTAVKPCSADGTATSGRVGRRLLPFYSGPPVPQGGPFFMPILLSFID